MNSTSMNLNSRVKKFSSAFISTILQFFIFFLQILAGKREYEALIKLRRETLKTLYGGFPWDSQYTYCQFQMKLNGNSGEK